MIIQKCTFEDVTKLAEMNKQLIEDEKSDNKMNKEELNSRMSMFLHTDYCAYFFVEENTILGYALVNVSLKPIYLRQFFVKREYRRNHLGKKAFEMLLEELQVDSIDIEVLSWNETGLKFWESLGFVERSRYMRRSR